MAFFYLFRSFFLNIDYTCANDQLDLCDNIMMLFYVIFESSLVVIL